MGKCHIFNPWMGCAKVSPGCANCYAETLTRNRMGLDVWGDSPRKRTADANWRKPLAWNRDAEREGKRRRVFCASLADVFEERPEVEPWRIELFELIWQTPWLDWLVLTKRPEFARDWLRATGAHSPNVWMGTSIENTRHTWRADVLREIPDTVRFISAEPLLGSLLGRDSRRSVARLGPNGGRGGESLSGNDSRTAPIVGQPAQASAPTGAQGGDVATRSRSPLDLSDSEERDEELRGARLSGGAGGRSAESLPTRAATVYRRRLPDRGADGVEDRSRRPLDLTGIDWVICGGESGGPESRPMHPAWARELRDAAAHAGVAFHYKQSGCWAPYAGGGLVLSADGRSCEFSDLTDDLEFVEPVKMRYCGAGPESGGRLLDGHEYLEFPAPRVEAPPVTLF